jgi:hypothetical protein
VTADTRNLAIGGAVSLGAALVAPVAAQADDFKVTNKGDSGAGSLRQAVENAATSLDPDDRILFDSKLSGEIALTRGQLYINGSLAILGPGAAPHGLWRRRLADPRYQHRCRRRRDDLRPAAE